MRTVCCKLHIFVYKAHILHITPCSQFPPLMKGEEPHIIDNIIVHGLPRVQHYISFTSTRVR